MKTAIEIIREHFYTYAEPYNGFSEEPKWTISEEDFEKLIQQAKEMEKEQKIKFAENCLDKALDLDIRTAFSNVEKYYNETFRQEEQ